MILLDNHIKLTITATILYFIINYIHNNKKLSNKFMKMFNIKNKNNIQLIYLVLFAFLFYLMINITIQGFKIGSQQEEDCSSHTHVESILTCLSNK